MSVDRDRLRRLADEATPGPWKVHHRCSGCTEMDDETCGLGLELDPGPEEPELRGAFSRSADARFIAACREAVPALLDLLDRCERALADFPPHTTVVKDAIGGGWMCATCSGLDPCRHARAYAVLAELRGAAS